MQRHNLYACPVGDSLWSPNGGTESPEGDGWYGSPPGRSFYSCKRNQNTLGAVPQDPLAAKLRLDTNDALASSVRRRRYALKVPAAHFILDSAGTELKINLISVVSSRSGNA